MVSVIYILFSSGLNVCELVLYVIVDNGLWWYVWVYDCKSNSFCDFVLIWISKVMFK